MLVCRVNKFAFGTFRDPVNAAKRYDKVAVEYRGARALLNFPPGRISSPTLAGAHKQTAAMPLGVGDVQEWPATEPQLPPGNAEGTAEPLSQNSAEEGGPRLS